MQYIVKEQVVLMGLMSFWSMCAHFCCMLAKVTKNDVFFAQNFILKYCDLSKVLTNIMSRDRKNAFCKHIYPLV